MWHGFKRGDREGGGEEGEGENSPYMLKHKSSTPLGPLPYFPFNFRHNPLRQGTGTAYHLSLGYDEGPFGLALPRFYGGRVWTNRKSRFQIHRSTSRSISQASQRRRRTIYGHQNVIMRHEYMSLYSCYMFLNSIVSMLNRCFFFQCTSA